MIGELVNPVTGREDYVSLPASATNAYFKHVSECSECHEDKTFGICDRGEGLLNRAAGLPVLTENARKVPQLTDHKTS